MYAESKTRVSPQANQTDTSTTAAGGASSPGANEAPALSLPSGGGAIRGIDEKLAVNPSTGTVSLSIPLPTPSGRGFAPSLALSYSSGGGNGIAGLGWNISSPAIVRRTEKGIPQYRDEMESDTFLGPGGDELVPLLKLQAGEWVRDITSRSWRTKVWQVHSYRARIESAYPRIERWVGEDSGEMFWKVTSGDNVTTVFGASSNSRIADSEDPGRRIAVWLVCENYDDKGNAVFYEYIAEDSRGVDVTAPFETQRTAAERAVNRYLKTVYHGNVTPRIADEDLSLRTDWMFKVVFDYGDHGSETHTPTQAWPTREDAFSNCMYGFEVRTYRLCQRVLVFHHFPDEAIGANCLVSSMDFHYQHSALFSQLKEVTQRGYIRKSDGTYESKALPPLAFDYTEGILDGAIHELTGAGLDNLPVGVDGSRYQWLDLDGEGLRGVISREQGGLFFKRNLGAGRLDTSQVVGLQPSFAESALFVDINTDGSVDAMQLGAVSGFSARRDDGGWAPFQSFDSMPNLDWQDPNVRLLDLTGDGRADILITHDDTLVWHPSLAEKGYAPAISLAMAEDERKGVRQVFNDGTETIFLADMSGDGLVDLVRIRNGAVCYWPNLGYGRFGKKVSMGGAPQFDEPDQFDPTRIILADVDGSGPADIIYKRREGAVLYANLSGNQFANGVMVKGLPPLDGNTRVDVVDLLGNGTACLVWSSPLPQVATSSLRYIELTGGIKPHLLYCVRNNMGAETKVEYTASTAYYLADKKAGRPWQTKLPFPIQCVSKTEIIDHITGYRFASEYAYSHGYYDKEEREFRGFGRVDQFDTDDVADFVGSNNSDERYHQPPVHTRTWYHLGMVSQRHGEADIYANEYYQDASQPEPGLKPSHLAWDFTPDELAEAMRAAKGAVVRSEAYMLDGTDKARHPLTATKNSFKLHRVQPRAGGNRHLVMRLSAYESITCQYDRNPLDPRINHALVLATNELGLPLKTASAIYGRKVADMGLPATVRAAQAKRYLSYSESDYCTPIMTADCYRLPVAYEQRSYDASALAPDPSGYYSVDGLITTLAGSPTLPMMARSHTRFLKNDLSGELGAGVIGELGLIHRSYRLAFTAAMITDLYGTRVTNAMLLEAGYVHLQGDADWWIPSSLAEYDPDAAAHFYHVRKVREPFGALSTTTFDAYDLLTKQTEDANGSVTQFTHDYRVLRPVMMTDANQNRSAASMDALGMVVATAIMGKAGASEGDTLADPSVRFEYDLDVFRTTGKPNFSRSFVREEHGALNPRWQESYQYTSGSGQVVMVKAQAEPGLAKRINPITDMVEEIDTGTEVRWVGTGRAVINNKGGVVKRYNPYFSTTPDYETDSRLVETGESSIITYDAMGRVIRTDNPDGTLAKVEFDAWQILEFDQNDTVLESQWYIDRGSPNPLGEPEPADPARRAAWLSAKHANTPTLIHLDSLGGRVCTQQDNGAKGLITVTAESNPTTRVTRYFDTLGREVGALFMNFVAAACRRESPEKGTRYGLMDIYGQILYEWDAQARQLRYRYDALRRPVASYLLISPAAEVLQSFQVFGEALPDSAARNARGKLVLAYDQSGEVKIDGYDFKGHPTHIARRYAKNYKTIIDWKALEMAPNPAAIMAAADGLLEIESFSTSYNSDALGRPKMVVLPDTSRIIASFNQANTMETLSVQWHGAGATIPLMTGQDRNARGERLAVNYGNNTRTSYRYDELSNHLVQLTTTRTTDSAILQDFTYTYDAAGHKVEVVDAAQQAVYFNNAVAQARWRYEYDAVYQLIKATGREHSGMIADTQRNHLDVPIFSVPHANDAAAMRTYTQTYEHDALGNLLSMQHMATGANWTRRYHYAYQDDATNKTNRLSASSEPGDAAGVFSAHYNYDPAGNMTTTPAHAGLVWNNFDQLREADLGGGGRAYYVYSANGMRVRKVIERIGGAKEERLYLGAVEYHRKSQAGVAKFERQTLRIADDTGEIARIDTKVLDLDDPTSLNSPLLRYIYKGGGKSSLFEADKDGAVLSYEEYHPFGTSSYRSGRSQAEVGLKRYRFAMKECDEETGLYYFGTRYYAAWLGRWMSADSAGFVDGFNLYRYAQNDPINLSDSDGRAPSPVRWIVPSRVTTESQFETWARRQGIQYTGTPTYNTTTRVWSVESWRYVAPGSGGAAPVVPAAPPAAPTGTTGAPPVAPAAPPPSAATPPIPGRGEIGSVLPHPDHPPSEYTNPLDRATRLTEDEHPMPGAQLRDMTRNPRTGISDYGDSAYENDSTAHIERRTALAKTNGPGGDNAATTALRSRVSGGGSINYREDIFEASRQRFIAAARSSGSGITEEAINRAILEQEGNLFNTFRGNAVLNALPTQTFGQRVAEGVRNAYSRIVYNAQGYNRFSGAAGTLARGLIPGFVEAELVAMNAPALVAQAGITNATIVSTASAAAAAPAAAATVVVASAAGGYLVGGAVGHWVTDETGSEAAGAAAGTLAGAGTGALIGAAIGSVVPVLGTAAGAIIGGVVGGVAGLIGSLW